MAITATLGATASNATAGTSLAFASAAQVRGQIVVVAVALLNTASSVSSISDGTNTFTQVSAQTNGSSVRVELWNMTVASSATRTITVNFSSSTLASTAYEEYAGAASGVGNTGTPATGTSFYPESDVATQDANNWSVAGVAVASSSGDTFANDLGTQRQKVIPALTTASVVLIDNSSVSTTAALRNTVQLSASRAWAAASLELRTGATPITVQARNVVLFSNVNNFSNHQKVTPPANVQSVISTTANTGFVG